MGGVRPVAWRGKPRAQRRGVCEGERLGCGGGSCSRRCRGRRVLFGRREACGLAWKGRQNESSVRRRAPGKDARLWRRRGREKNAALPEAQRTRLRRGRARRHMPPREAEQAGRGESAGDGAEARGGCLHASWRCMRVFFILHVLFV